MQAKLFLTPEEVVEAIRIYLTNKGYVPTRYEFLVSESTRELGSRETTPAAFNGADVSVVFLPKEANDVIMSAAESAADKEPETP